ncbi:MAG: thiolase family protein [Actinobacteria bacterium]|nr:thiolase family protein [Actinomycetota bacterium]
MREAVIVEAVRTPVAKGRANGALASVHPVDLLADTLRGLIDRAGIDAGALDDVIGGCGMQVGEQAFNLTRTALLAAGIPEHVPATTIDRQCGSSQQAVHFAAQGVIAGAYDAVIACGVESMSRVPMFSNIGDKNPFGTRLFARYSEGLLHQGISAELIASKWKLTREELDELAAESHRRAAVATAAGAFEHEILPVDVPTDDGVVTFTADEGIRPDTTAGTLAGLRPAFYDEALNERFPEIDWTVTAGNSSQISDGASATLVMERSAAERLGLRPKARIVGMAVKGDDPLLMLTAVIPATRDVLRRTGLSIDDIDAFEVNEAFAPVVLAWARETNADLAKVNVHGGAIALGHPIGASGTRLLATLLGVLERTGGRYGLQTMCEGGGMANATVIERLA